MNGNKKRQVKYLQKQGPVMAVWNNCLLIMHAACFTPSHHFHSLHMFLNAHNFTYKMAVALIDTLANLGKRDSWKFENQISLLLLTNIWYSWWTCSL